MKYSLGVSHLLEEISRLFHSIVFLSFFTLITEEVFLISPSYSLELCIQMDMSLLFSFAFQLHCMGVGEGVAATVRKYPTSKTKGETPARW